MLFNALKVTQDSQKQMITADVTVTRDGQPFARMYPARWYFVGREGEPTTEVALRRGFAHDLHLVLANFEVGSQEVHLQITINPLVNWVWFGVGVMVFGTIIALLPERAFAFATVPRAVEFRADVADPGHCPGAWWRAALRLSTSNSRRR